MLHNVETMIIPWWTRTMMMKRKMTQKVKVNSKTVELQTDQESLSTQVSLIPLNLNLKKSDSYNNNEYNQKNHLRIVSKMWNQILTLLKNKRNNILDREANSMILFKLVEGQEVLD